MNPTWRDRVCVGASAVLAMVLGLELAEGSLEWPLIVAALSLASVGLRFVRISFDVLLLGGLLAGYLIGNRGFAQLMLAPRLPLLPAEFVLLVAAAIQTWRHARSGMLPWRKDAINFAILAWMAVGAARIALDARAFGLVAVRDFAIVYYASFFFLAQSAASAPRARDYLLRCILFGSACLPFVLLATELFPDFFLSTLSFRGSPLIYFKGDIAPTFMCVASAFIFLNTPRQFRWWARPLACAMVLWVLAGDNRASILGAVAMLTWIAISRERSFAWLQAGVASLALLALVAFAAWSQNPAAEHRLRTITDRTLSIVDFNGVFSYRSPDSSIKADNNLFRAIWWKSVINETLSKGPVFGLGFGHDLAQGFLRNYNPEMADDFTARSPHNLLVTIFGRMGLVGLAPFLAFLFALTIRTHRHLTNATADQVGLTLWSAPWPILVASMLGVVLEGPMGAVVFWTLLGLANGYGDSPSPGLAMHDEGAHASPRKQRIA